MGRRDELRDAWGRAEALRLRLGLLQADANLRARRVWDAWGGVHRDVAGDARRRVRRREVADAQYAGKLAGRGRGVREQDAKLLRARRRWAAVSALCRQGAGRSAA